jgi:hypothetical protein
MRFVNTSGLRCFAVILFVLMSKSAESADVSFRHDVMAVLSKAGCNAGTCHGNQNGKGGFKLSLRGEDPAADFAALTHGLASRRVNPLAPAQSLILLKPTLSLAHQGGRRFAPDSIEYRTIVNWIAAGAADDPTASELIELNVAPSAQVLYEPQTEVRLSVSARFADGTRRDVTRMAVYEPSHPIVTLSPDGVATGTRFGETTVLVRYLNRQTAVRLTFVPARDDFVWTRPSAFNRFDGPVLDKLHVLRVLPADVCDDSTFVRRVFLDLIGLLPTADEARSFVTDLEPDKRGRAVDRLLARREFAEHWAMKWADLLRVEEKQLDRTGVTVFHEWIRDNIARGRPLDQFAGDILSARGSTYKSAPANFWRALRDPLSRGEAVAQVFLGTRLQCAKCHNHPFERWTQEEYYRWAALFARIDYKIIKNERRDDLDKHEFNGEQIVLYSDKGEVPMPSRGGDPAKPKFLGESDTAQPAADGQDRLSPLARWLTHPEHPQFARVQANRIWGQLLGRGLVDPIDDFRANNPPSHPELLEMLSAELVRSRFDLRHLVRNIVESRTYQLSAPAKEPLAGDFAAAIVTRLTAEQLLDAIYQVTGGAPEFAGYPSGLRAGQLPGVRAYTTRRRGQRPTSDDRFLMSFGKPERLLVCDCERSNGTTLAQAFSLVGGPVIERALAKANARLAAWASPAASPEQVIDDLYWTALTRPPTAEEQARCVELLRNEPDRAAALQDIVWAVVNSKEFVFRH